MAAVWTVKSKRKRDSLHLKNGRPTKPISMGGRYWHQRYNHIKKHRQNANGLVMNYEMVKIRQK